MPADIFYFYSVLLILSYPVPISFIKFFFLSCFTQLRKIKIALEHIPRSTIPGLQSMFMF